MEEQILNVFMQLLLKQKKEYTKEKTELQNGFRLLKGNINLLNKFLSMMKKNSDINKKDVNRFYKQKIFPIFIDMMQVREFVELIDIQSNKSLEQRNYIESIVDKIENITLENNYIELATEIKNIFLLSIEQYENRINIINNNIYHLNGIISSIRKDNYYKDKKKLNTIIEEIKKEEYGILCDLLVKYINDKYLNYISEIEESKLNNFTDLPKYTESLSSNINENENKNDNKYYFDKTLFFNEDEIELIDAVRHTLYDNSNNINRSIKYLNDEKTYKYIYECLKHSDKEIVEMGLLEESKIKIYRLDILIFELRRTLSEIDNMVDIINNNKYSNEQVQKLIPEKEKKILKLNNLYDEFEDINNIDSSLIEKATKKSIIYLTSPNGKTYIEKKVIDDNSVAEEHYAAFYRMLSLIENGVITADPRKDGKYTSNDKITLPILKKKNLACRIQYILLGDVAVILTGFVKKYNISRIKDTKSFKDICNIAYNQIEQLKKDLKDEDKKNQILSENAAIHERIMNTLQNKARGDKRFTK